MTRTILAVCPGDPASIGPEVFLKSAAPFLEDKEFKSIDLHVFGSEGSLKIIDKKLWNDILSTDRVKLNSSDSLDFQIGIGTKETAAFAMTQLHQAATSCLDKTCSALVTGPVDKQLCSLSEPQFTGQTGFLKKLSDAPSVTMMLACNDLRVALVTVHLPLKQVAEAVTEDSIDACLRNSIEHLRSIGLSPRIAVLGLNPHASDNGLMGDEERKVISPAIRRAKKEFDIQIDGPLPADTAFLNRASYDVFVCMYHDQALIPIKLLDFERSVNMSLGLPFLRTSVDHGTAFDIAGKNKASALSFLEALKVAARSSLIRA